MSFSSPDTPSVTADPGIKADASVGQFGSVPIQTQALPGAGMSPMGQFGQGVVNDMSQKHPLTASLLKMLMA